MPVTGQSHWHFVERQRGKKLGFQSAFRVRKTNRWVSILGCILELLSLSPWLWPNSNGPVIAAQAQHIRRNLVGHAPTQHSRPNPNVDSRALFAQHMTNTCPNSTVAQLQLARWLASTRLLISFSSAS
ncbi:hypothetical protein SDJN03_00923, partial [Cucurbita argyrosperma subsp. sororia]